MQSLTRRSSYPLISLVACAVLSAIAGCGSKGVVGKWSGSIPLNGQSVAVVAEYKADGTEEQTATIMGHAMLVRSTYTTKDDTMTETIVSATFDGRTIPQMAAAGKTQTFTYKLDGDTLTLTTAGKPAVVLKRAEK